MEQKKNALRSAAYFFIIVMGIVVVFFIFKVLQDIFIPLIIAYFLFFVFSPLNNFLAKKKIPVWGYIIIDIFIVLLIFTIFSSVIINSFLQFGDQLPEYQKKLDSIVSSSAVSLGINDPSLRNFHISDIAKNIDYKMVAGNMFTSTFSAIGTLFFVLFFYIFIVTGHSNIYNAIKKRQLNGSRKVHSDKSHTQQSEEKTTQKEKTVEGTFEEITFQVQHYMVTKFVISLITAIVEGLAIWIFGVDFVIVWTVLIFVLNFVPNIGSIIALTLPVLMALVQFGSITTALILGIVLFILDTIMGNIVEPKVFGEQLDLNPLIILLSLLLWGYIWGIIGALLSVPLTAIIKIMISKSDSPNLIFIHDLMSGNTT